MRNMQLLAICRIQMIQELLGLQAIRCRRIDSRQRVGCRYESAGGFNLFRH